MFGLFSKRRTNRVQAPATRDMVMKTVSDAGGFDFGVIWQPSLGQGTILLAGETSFSLEDIAAWRRVASTVIGVTVISTIVVSGEDPAITYAFVTFDAEKKSCDDFLTWLAKQVVQVYSPEELEIMWWPQDAESVTRHACTLWAPDSDPVFPRLRKHWWSIMTLSNAIRYIVWLLKFYYPPMLLRTLFKNSKILCPPVCSRMGRRYISLK